MTFSIYVAGWTLIHFVWQGALVAAVAAMVLRLLDDGAPKTRYLVACTALAAMLAAPLVTAGFIDEPPPNRLSAAADGAPEVRLRRRSPVAPGREGVLVLNRVQRSSAPWQARVDPILPALVATWMIGVFGLLLRLAGGWWRVRRLRRAALAAASSKWLAAAQRMAERLGVRRTFHVVDSLIVETPTLVGWLRPIVLLPVAALANLTPQQVDALIVHELAHIRRHDYLVNVLQTIAETLLFYHPAVWWVSACIRAEREHCCDDVVVETMGDAAGYAAALTELETMRTRRTSLALAATSGPLLTRVRRLLDAGRDEPQHSSLALAVVLGVGALLVFVVGGLRSPSAARAGLKRAGDIALPAPSAPLLARQPQLRRVPPPPPSPPPAPRGNWRRSETDHLLLTCPADVVVDLERVGREAERAYSTIAADLRTDLSGRPTLTVFSTRAELQQALATGLVRPARESLGQVLIALDVSDDQLRRDLVIDLARVFAFEIVPPSVIDRPFWMHDGLAEHESGVWDRADVAVASELVASRSVPRVSRIVPSTFATRPRLPLIVGHAAFDFIEARWGKDGVRRFLAAARRPPAGAASLYDAAFNVGADEFDRAFEEYLTGTYNAPGRSPLPRQGRAEEQPTFDLLSVAPSTSGRAQQVMFQRPNGPLVLTSFTVRELLRFAYQLGAARILGGPSWLDSERFDLTATWVKGAAPDAVGFDRDLTAEQTPVVIRQLVAKAFNLDLRRERRPFPAYGLMLAHADGALGPHLRRSAVDCATRVPPTRGKPPCGRWDFGPMGTTVVGVTMPQVAENIGRVFADRDVIDVTGLTGTFDLDLDVFLPAIAFQRDHPAASSLVGLGSLFGSVFTVVEQQLGLRLEPRTAPGDVLIVERAEKPEV